MIARMIIGCSRHERDKNIPLSKQFHLTDTNIHSCWQNKVGEVLKTKQVWFPIVSDCFFLGLFGHVRTRP